ncbi:MAG: glycosyltransferase [Chloroflexi bacterium]|nr:glycosyltransferase [Chloroflexota bacterium]
MKHGNTINQNLVAIYLPDLSGGGEERILLNLADRLTIEGFEVDLLLVQKTGALVSMVPSSINVISFETSSVLSLVGLISYLRRRRPVVLHSSLELTNLLAILAKGISRISTRTVIRIAITVSFHKRSFLKNILEKFLLRTIYPRADEIIAVSYAVREDLSIYAGIEIQRIRTIYNPIVHPSIYTQAKEPISHPWLVKENAAPVVLGVGRLTPQKDFSTLIKAFALVREIIDCRLIILGEGELDEELRSLVRRLNLGDDVDMPGFVGNPYAYISKASVYVLSSQWEGLPSVVIEALALGCPVVSTDCPSGIREILDGGKYGEILPMRDAPALAAAIEKTLRGEIRQAVDNEWLEQFSMEAAFPKILEALGLS